MLVGIRNLDEIEKKLVRASKVHVFTMKDIDRLGIARGHGARAGARRSTAPAGSTSRSISTSCDPTIAPGVGTPVKGGLNYREAHVVMEMVADSGRLTSLDLVEVNPTLDMQKHDRRARHRARAVGAGKKIL